jgi:hypothetical protein
MAVRIFFAMGSLLIKEIRRSGLWHFGHRVSIPNTLRRSSDHRMYFGVLLGLPWPGWGWGATGGTGAGTTSFREDACEESTPQ